jgi:hypothetical protein
MKSDKSDKPPATSATSATPKKREITSDIFIAGKSICKKYLKTYLSGDKDEVIAVYAITTDDGEDLVFAKKDKIGFELMQHCSERMLQLATENYDDLELLQSAVIYADLNGMAVEPEIRRFLAKIKQNPNIRPKNKGGRPTDYRLNTMIYCLVLELQNLGLYASRNSIEVERDDGMSACDAIAETFKELGDDRFNYTAIAQRWFRESNRLAPKSV